MKRIYVMAVLLLLLTQIFPAPEEPEIQVRKQTMEYLNNDSLKIELVILLSIPPDYLTLIPEPISRLDYSLHMILKTTKGNIASIKQINREIVISPEALTSGVRDTIQVMFKVKRNNYRLSILPLDFPVYIKAIRDIPIRSLEETTYKLKRNYRSLILYSTQKGTIN